LYVTLGMAGIVEQLDNQIAGLLAGWNAYTTVIAAALIGYLGWLVYDTQDADTHPLLLARQAQASYVRQPGESAIYRSPETPHGCMKSSTSPLRRMANDIQTLFGLVLQ
jgi:hypothetical protein